MAILKERPKSISDLEQKKDVESIITAIKKRPLIHPEKILLVYRSTSEAEKAYKKHRASFDAEKVMCQDGGLEIHYKGVHLIKFVCEKRAYIILISKVLSSRYTKIFRTF